MRLTLHDSIPSGIDLYWLLQKKRREGAFGGTLLE